MRGSRVEALMWLGSTKQPLKIYPIYCWAKVQPTATWQTIYLLLKFYYLSLNFNPLRGHHVYIESY